jgi:hypothetical protein
VARGGEQGSRVAGWVGSGEEAVRLAGQGFSAVVRGGVGLARLTCLRLRANKGRVDTEAEKSESDGRV